MLHRMCKGKEDGLNNGETEILRKEGLTSMGKMFIPFLYLYPLQAFLHH